jgi:hypothetical protein
MLFTNASVDTMERGRGIIEAYERDRRDAAGNSMTPATRASRTGTENAMVCVKVLSVTVASAGFPSPKTERLLLDDERHSNSATTGAWSLVPTSGKTLHEVALSFSLAST